MDQLTATFSLNAKEAFKLLTYHHFLYCRTFYYVFLAIELIVFNQIGSWHKTDILVLCIPIVFPVFMVYLIWIQSRNESAPARRNIHLEMNSEQIRLSDDTGNSSVMVWSFIKAFKKIGGVYVLYLKNNSYLFIPERVLSGEEELILRRLAK